MSSRRTNNIKVLLEQLGSLQINEKASTNDKQMDTEMLTAPVITPTVNKLAGMLRSMVPDLGWFDSD